MNNWNLASRSGFYHSENGSIREDISGSEPLIIDPSITFRKHFELPTQVDRDPETLKLELFSRFLPADLDEYVCQFVMGPRNDRDSRKILGLAVKENDLRWLEGIHGEDNDKYLLERMIRPPSDQSNCILELELPKGVFMGVFEDGFLDWCRFLKSTGEEERKQTRNYIENEYSYVETRRESPSFTVDNGTDWTTFLDSWIPSQPEPDAAVSRESEGDFWGRWRTTAWLLLVLATLTVGTWWSYNYYTLVQHQNWIQKQSDRFLDDSGDPLTSLNSAIEQRRSTLQTTEEALDVYPRVADVDAALAQLDVELIQLKIAQRQGQVSVLTDSLSTAENLKDRLRDQGGISETEIVSTTPREESAFQFKVDVNVLWSPNQDRGGESG
jgi:hypothetical protein